MVKAIFVEFLIKIAYGQNGKGAKGTGNDHERSKSGL